MRYIDADAFAEKMKRQYCESCDNYQGIRCNSCHCGDWLDDLSFEPTADVRKNVKGEWLDYNDNPLKSYFDGRYSAHCSVCGYHPEYEEEMRNANFCPNCGAEMRGEE